MDALVISHENYREMIRHVQQNLPEEACGILAGKSGMVEKVIPVTNQAHSPVRFYMDPIELLHALEWMEAVNFELMGIFHSHPSGPSLPSETDIKEFLYPGTATVILSNVGVGWTMRGFNIHAGVYNEIAITIIRNQGL